MAGVAGSAGARGRIALRRLDIGDVDDVRRPRGYIADLGRTGRRLASPRVILLRPDRRPRLAEPGDAGSRQPADSAGVGPLSECEDVQTLRARSERVCVLE